MNDNEDARAAREARDKVGAGQCLYGTADGELRLLP